MRTKIKTEHYIGEMKESIKFAWLPVVIDDYLVWFERYKEKKIWKQKRGFNGTAGRCYNYEGWIKTYELLL